MARLRHPLVVDKLEHVVPNRVEVHEVLHEGDLQLRCMGLGEELDKQQNLELLWPRIPCRVVVIHEVPFELVDDGRQVSHRFSCLSGEHSYQAVEIRSSAQQIVPDLEVSPRINPVAWELFYGSERFVGRMNHEEVCELLAAICSMVAMVVN